MVLLNLSAWAYRVGQGRASLEPEWMRIIIVPLIHQYLLGIPQTN